jgi:hypothetical protein
MRHCQQHTWWGLELGLLLTLSLPVYQMDELKKYNAYSANNEQAGDTVNKLTRANPSFAALAEEVKRLEECKKLDLAAYIIKPFQRICRYPLLLKVCRPRWRVVDCCCCCCCCRLHSLSQELREATPPEWEDYGMLQQAVEEINGTVKGANETKRVTDDLYKIVELQNKFISCVCYQLLPAPCVAASVDSHARYHTNRPENWHNCTSTSL